MHGTADTRRPSLPHGKAAGALHYLVAIHLVFHRASILPLFLLYVNRLIYQTGSARIVVRGPGPAESSVKLFLVNRVRRRVVIGRNNYKGH